MISKWVLKAIVQKVISYLPAKERINFFFQKYVTKGVFLNDTYFENKITHAKDHISYFQKYSSQKPENSHALELGTGWYPIVPICLFLHGFQKIVSIDIQSWATQKSIIQTLKKFIEWDKSGKLHTFLPNLDTEKWNTLLQIYKKAESLSKDELLAQFTIHTQIEDARKTSFADDTFDLICSNNTFEHIPQSILQAILQEFIRVGKPQSVMSHFVDLTDHFAHFDQKITIYNFLKFSSSQWKWIDNSIQPMNRLRWKDYQNMYDELTIPITQEEIRKGDLQALQTIQLAKEFSSYSLDELAISHGYFVSQLPK